MFRTLVPTHERFHRPLERFEREMEHLMGRFFGPELPWREGDFTPRLNIAETEGAYEVSVDLPGLKPEDVKVEVKSGELWVTGERREEKEEKGKTFHRVERYSGQFRRIIPLPTRVVEERVVANYTDGVLKVMLPKAEESRPRQISVNTT